MRWNISQADLTGIATGNAFEDVMLDGIYREIFRLFYKERVVDLEPFHRKYLYRHKPGPENETSKHAKTDKWEYTKQAFHRAFLQLTIDYNYTP